MRKKIAESKMIASNRITIPPEIREILKVKEGDHVLFIDSEAGVVLKKGILVPSEA